MDAERRADPALRGLDALLHRAWQGAPIRIAQHHAVRSRSGGRRYRGQGIFRVQRIPVEEMLGIVHDFLAELLEVRHAIGDHREILVARRLEHALDMEARALAHQGDHGRARRHQGLDARVVGAANARAAGAAERGQLGAPQARACDPLEELGVLRVRARPAAFDVRDAQRVEPLGDLELVLDGQGETRALRAVA